MAKKEKQSPAENPEVTEELDTEVTEEAGETPGTPEEPVSEPETEEETAQPEDEADAKVAELAEKLQEANDRYVRLMAEFDNYRKRTQKEKESVYPDAVANTVEKFLPILDNFDRALQTPCSDENFLKGISMIEDSFKQMLESLNITEIGEVGEKFDPKIHNAVMHVDDESLEKDVVSMVLQKGYKMGDKIIRCAMVQQAN